ncbi:MAG: osmotically-inducible lipoprotein B [Sodalis sp. (in: enterobacteria)]|uniref:osmotically-inducible lipoprotein B n=1 Tax=Sodalis sp. (in: enterobacteria) TaxID=1898979 RepID=UPI003F2DB9A9
MSSTSKRMAAAALAVTLALSLSACSNWSKRDHNTAIGASAIGGADGGIIGHQVD